MNDFSPEIRNAALWSGDARRIAAGKHATVYLEKLGRYKPEDISEEENVKMGLVMQPVIGRLFEDKHNIRIKEYDLSRTHAKHDFIKSHFDFEFADRSALVEVKNYNAAIRNKFGDDGTPEIPITDRFQCIHEAMVYGTNTVYLAILFGGQEFCTYPLTITEQDKETLLNIELELWDRIQKKIDPEGDCSETIKLLYPQSIDKSVTANQDIERICGYSKALSQKIKELETEKEACKVKIRNFMKDKGTLMSFDGSVLATWKNDKPSKRFSADLLEKMMPDTYEKFCYTGNGYRKLLIK